VDIREYLGRLERTLEEEERLRSYQRFELGPDHEENQRLQTLLAEGVTLLEARSAILFRRTGTEGMELIAYQGYPPDRVAKRRWLPIEADIPMAEALRRSQPIHLANRNEYVTRYRRVAALAGSLLSESLISLPLSVEGQYRGVVSFGFSEPRPASTEVIATLLSHYRRGDDQP
jgi:hypothetical protein